MVKQDFKEGDVESAENCDGDIPAYKQSISHIHQVVNVWVCDGEAVAGGYSIEVSGHNDFSISFDF